MDNAYSLRTLQATFQRREIRTETYRRVRADVMVSRSHGPFEDNDFEEAVGPIEYWPPVEALIEADGVRFLCPKCFHANNGEVGTHSVVCWFVGKVSDDVDPKPGRWNPQGDLDNLTFVGPGSVSVLLTGGCGWHGLVVDGHATLT